MAIRYLTTGEVVAINQAEEESLVTLAIDTATGRFDVEAIAATLKDWARPRKHEEG